MHRASLNVERELASALWIGDVNGPPERSCDLSAVLRSPLWHWRLGLSAVTWDQNPARSMSGRLRNISGRDDSNP